MMMVAMIDNGCVDNGCVDNGCVGDDGQADANDGLVSRANALC